MGEVTDEYIHEMIDGYDKDDLTILVNLPNSMMHFHWQNRIVSCLWVHTWRPLIKRMNWQIMNAVMWYIAP